MLSVFQPPASLPHPGDRPSVFLAGSIEMGSAEDWQSVVVEALNEHPLDVFNPRRDDWDSSWVEDISQENFRQQVEWELAALDQADLIIMYFSPRTKAPVTLLEFGLFARTGKLRVCCPPGYWKRGNVQIVCQQFGIPLTNNLTELIGAAEVLCQ